ncbi:terminal uridylyltransferase 7-like [Macrosteles quadrilineatus]|uniref:terminal uridylyltransferase 7-like n=1 Tax=Macrosteles quadrilineatus TaxID=74068 RepID=UPI0023E26854|nr:terminal uridylyltransferase 7-like [Macrosteles quadrilineatus]
MSMLPLMIDPSMLLPRINDLSQCDLGYTIGRPLRKHPTCGIGARERYRAVGVRQTMALPPLRCRPTPNLPEHRAVIQHNPAAYSHVQQHISDVTRMIHKHRYMNEDNIPVSYIEQNCVPPRHMYGNMSVSPQDAHQLVSSFSAKLMEYSLARRLLTGGEEVPRICGVCKCEGHLKEECPEEKLPPLDPIPERLPGELKIVDQLCLDIFERLKQSDEDLQKREKICQELQEFIGAEYPTAKLELFGSTKNGFGLKGSDMDICLSFEDNKTGEGLDTRGFIEILYQILKQSKDLQDLLPIATAKVPIVKFTHKSTKLDGDISLYNVLALENSKLLCTYAQIDERARVLGYMIKRFSKICHIGDASKGSLSSYAYTLLVIYFLQRCDPPVLPVLQELTENAEPPPKHIVEGCNAYFFSDLTKLTSAKDLPPEGLTRIASVLGFFGRDFFGAETEQGPVWATPVGCTFTATFFIEATSARLNCLFSFWERRFSHAASGVSTTDPFR